MRAKAIIVLMRIREDLVDKLVPLEQATREDWDGLYAKHMESPSTNTAEVLGQETGLGTEHVADVLRRMIEHHHRVKNLEVA